MAHGAREQMGRRSFLSAAGTATAGAALVGGLGFGPLGAVGASPAGRGRRARPRDGLELVPVADQATGLELVKLPRGFEYVSYGWRGDRMDDGIATPSAHDGMAAFRRGDAVHLVRNHEQGSLSGAFASGMTYDPAATGGTTTVEFDPDAGAFTRSYASLAGTFRNCAGGPTPWGTWLSCEETTLVNGAVRHGYVFEVPACGTAADEPLRAMGRFSHEAAAVDPATGIVYLTEDATPSGLYRFVPDVAGRLAAGGRLQMAAIGASSRVTYGDTAPHDYGEVSWVDVDEPDPGPGEPSTVTQGIARGGAQFERLEGIWHHEGTIWFASTSGGPQRGQIFAYTPGDGRLRLVFHSPGPEVLDSPDNICVSPRGGLVLCEDGSGREYLHVLTPDGDIFPFAENNVVLDGHRGFFGDFTGAEWCGATFEPKNGSWLFVNIYTPGITLAITGPFRRLGL
ncbi:MAG TPA: alkaline phosphatase PhoX [Acidimicrobiales bacterium]